VAIEAPGFENLKVTDLLIRVTEWGPHDVAENVGCSKQWR